MFAENIDSRKTDLLVIHLSNRLEIMNTEVSGPPFKVTREHSWKCQKVAYDVCM